MTSIDLTSDELIEVVEFFAARLALMDETAVRTRSADHPCTVIEILGQLVDSAANYHQYFVRALSTDCLEFPGYDPQAWVECQHYAHYPWDNLVQFWKLYNIQLAHIIRQIPDAKMRVKCTILPERPVSLSFLIEEYLTQTKEKLNKITERSGI